MGGGRWREDVPNLRASLEQLTIQPAQVPLRIDICRSSNTVPSSRSSASSASTPPASAARNDARTPARPGRLLELDREHLLTRLTDLGKVGEGFRGGGFEAVLLFFEKRKGVSGKRGEGGSRGERRENVPSARLRDWTR